MNETYEFSDRVYLKPEVDRDERLAFVDNLRKTQANEVERIGRDTYNLGTQVPSNLGGLNGASGVWEQRHVNPAVNSTIAQLQATAQSSALNTALNNMKEQYQKLYNDEYLAAKKRERNKNNNGGPNGGDPEVPDGTVNENGYDPEDVTTVVDPATPQAGGNQTPPVKLPDSGGGTVPINHIRSKNFNGVTVYKDLRTGQFGLDGPMMSVYGTDNVRAELNRLYRGGYDFGTNSGLANKGKPITPTDILLQRY